MNKPVSPAEATEGAVDALQPMATIRPRKRKKAEPVGRQVDEAQLPLLLDAVDRSLVKGPSDGKASADPFKDEVLPLFLQTREEYLGLARRVALELYRKLQRPVTVDDVRKVCAPPPEWDGRVMGAIFMGGDWEWNGFERSQRTTCHKRGISNFVPVLR